MTPPHADARGPSLPHAAASPPYAVRRAQLLRDALPPLLREAARCARSRTPQAPLTLPITPAAVAPPSSARSAAAPSAVSKSVTARRRAARCCTAAASERSSAAAVRANHSSCAAASARRRRARPRRSLRMAPLRAARSSYVTSLTMAMCSRKLRWPP
ncbi:hypothetical protein JKP88DRAFT_237649 [Tribonema minus]|uniref:Uncharacterized protein n=1 Tax=Tribonema minus TaxID=303371 RepID=A0A835YZI1_9STRA|nr:hypothetical protein JKP88DRAFT_237649 [Tribonema minus]